LTYLTVDGLSEGVGASQVLAYAERIAGRGVPVHVHSFEKGTPTPQLVEQVRAAGITWTAHPFGAAGARGGVGRVLRGARAVKGAELVHARSDLPAASALLARSPTWVWDVRSLWADQRIALGALTAGGPEHRALQRIEAAAARRAAGVVTLTHAVLPVLDARHGSSVSAKAAVIPTCVDLRRFVMEPMPSTAPIRLLLAGTLNTFYDVPAMLALVAVGRSRGRAALDVLSPSSTQWDNALSDAGATRATATPAEMPHRVCDSHVGLSVCRTDAGVSLTAAMPTKIAEFLASGRPVVVNPGLGDADDLVEQAGAGLVLRDLSPKGFASAWDRIEELVADPETPTRCRELAESHFDLEKAVDRLLQLYADVSQRL
jgi:glycosyltransferase involved in cell wall biosynthesis